MTMLRFNPDGLHKPIACYSQCVRRGNMVAVSGMASLDKNGTIVGANDISSQTRQTIANMRIALEAAGASLADVAKVTVYLSSFAHYPGMDDAYREVFGAFPPARATVRADLVYPELLIEMEAWAILAPDAP
jgi:aminoacrylate peracid reductase